MPYSRNRKFTTKERNRLPDSAFLLPKQRKLPFKQVQGGKLRISISHVRNALARANQVQDVPRSEVQAAVRRARMILDSRGGYKSAPPRPISLAANGEGLSNREAEEFAEHLISGGIQPLDIEVLPLGATRKCAVMYWTGYEWEEVFSQKDAGEIMGGSYRSNKGNAGLTLRQAERLAGKLENSWRVHGIVKKGRDHFVEVEGDRGPILVADEEDLMFAYNGSEGLTKAQATKLARELQRTWNVHGIVKKGRDHFVEVEGDRGPILVADEEDLMFAYNGSEKSTTLSKRDATALAGQLKGTWNVLGIKYQRGEGWAVEVEGDRGPILVADEEDLMFAYNGRGGMRRNFFRSKKKTPEEIAIEEEAAAVVRMRQSSEWKSFFNGISSDYAMRGAKPPPIEERKLIADASFREYHAQRKRRASSGMARNKRY